MLILGLLGMYFDAAVVFVTNSSLFFRLAMAILCMNKSFFGQKRIIWALVLLVIFTYCTFYQKSTIECKFGCITYCKVASSKGGLGVTRIELSTV